MDDELTQKLETRLQNNPKSLLFARLADHYLKTGQFDKAISICHEGIKNHPAYVTGHFILGKAYMMKGDHEKAEAEFKKVLSHDMQYIAAHKHLGDLMIRMGWENKAVSHYKDILSIDPLNESARQMLETISSEGRGREGILAEDRSKERTLSATEELPDSEHDKNWAEQLAEVFVRKSPAAPSKRMPKPSEKEAPHTPLESDETLTKEIEEIVSAPPLFAEEQDAEVDTPEEKRVKEKTISSHPSEIKSEGETPLLFDRDTLADEMEAKDAAPSEELREETESETTQKPFEGENDKDQKIVSPTLGEIYAAQGQYGKAIRVYEILLGKYPEEADEYRRKIGELKIKLNG